MNRLQLTRGLPALLLAGVLALAVGYLALDHRTAAVGLLAVTALAALLSVHRWSLAVVAVPAVWLARPRVGGFLAAGDAVLLLAAATALVGGAATRLTPRARVVLVTLAVFLGLCSIAVAAHPSQEGATELFHRLLLVGGGVLVGGLLVRQALLRPALQLLLVVSLVFAARSIADGLGGSPAYPFGFHKNFAGSTFATVLLLLLTVPKEFGLRSPRLRVVLLLFVAGGLAATQSRGAILGAALGGLVWYFRSVRHEQGRAARFLGLVVLGVLAYVAITSVQSQLTQQRTTDIKINSLTQRTQVEKATRNLFRTSPEVGVGLRFYNTPKYSTYQAPNNVFDESLAESGLVGTAGLAALVVVPVAALWRVRDPLAVAAMAVLANSWFHGQIDIYWANGQSFTWLVVGAGLARSSPLAARNAGATVARWSSPSSSPLPASKGA